MRLALAIILDTFEKPDHTRRKVLVTFKVPNIAHLFHRILRFIGFNSILLTSQDTPEEHAGTILDFNDPKKCQGDGHEVLITTYALNIAGHNLQETCCTVISLEPAFSMAEKKQAFFRVPPWSDRGAAHLPHARAALVPGPRGDEVVHSPQFHYLVVG